MASNLQMTMFTGYGTLQYSINPYKLIVDVDTDIATYYRSLIPKYVHINKPMYSPHISVMRNEMPIHMEYWNKYHGEGISFNYEGISFNDSIYYWLNCSSPILEDIRIELGLTSTSIITRSPDGQHRFHMTIGNLKK